MTRPTRRRQSHAPDGAAQHRGWLDLVEISGPFLSLPVLRQAWPTLDALEKPTRDALRREHAVWRDDPVAGQAAWVRWVLTGLLGWGDELRDAPDDLEPFAMDVAEHETRVAPSFALVDAGEDVKPAKTSLLGLVCPPSHSPTARVPGSPWAATYVDRIAALCRHQGVELGLVTDGRRWALVWAPKDTATGTAVFDAIAWPEAAERDVVRAFGSILARSRFFGVRDDETLPALLRASLGSQEDITEALGAQVREAVELLVAALGREDLAARERGAPSLEGVDAHEVYRGAVSVMMRIVFLLFAEERRLLPADNDLYASTYSAGQLCAELERRALEGSEDDLEYTTVGWHRLLALFSAVHGGIDHPRLTMHAHDGSLFDPDMYVWLDLPVDDRTVLHMLRAVQYVEIGTGRSKERRSLSFRSLGVEEIGYVYEGLLAYDAFRAAEVVVGLAGKRGQEPEIELRELEKIAAHHTDLTALGGELSARFPNSGLGAAPAIAKKMRPLTGAAAEDARRKLLAATQGDATLADRLAGFYGLLRQDLRELPMVIRPGSLYVTDSQHRRNTGTHYTPRGLAERVIQHALEPLVFEGATLDPDTGKRRPKSSEEILALDVVDISVGSAAFLVAAARYLGERLIETWTREGDNRAQAYAVSDAQSEEDSVVVDARRRVIENCLYGADVNPMAVEMAKLSLWLVSMDSSRPFTFLDDRIVCGDSLLGLVSLDQLEYVHLDPREGRRLHRNPDLFDWAQGAGSLLSEAARRRERIPGISRDEAPLAALALKRAELYEAWSSLDQLTVIANLLLCPSFEGTTWLEVARLASEVSRGRGERSARETIKRALSREGSEAAPLHWVLKFPEVSQRGGFDAVVGNPPFLGGKRISGTLGRSYREYLVEYVASGIVGHADLVAYFLLRSYALLKNGGRLGLLATNSLAQGDTREVGLDRLVEQGAIIRRAISGAPWPSKSAALTYCAVWIEKDPSGTSCGSVLDGRETAGITPSLTAKSRASGGPERLLANQGKSFIGSYVLGDGFILDEADARTMIATSGRNSEVVMPYLSGQDVSTRSDCSPSRWVVNFRDWTEERAQTYAEPWARIESRVRPLRQRTGSDGEFVLRRPLPQKYWQYADKRPALVRASSTLDDVLVLSRVSKAVKPVRVSARQVLADSLVVFPDASGASLALLSSSVHLLWVIAHSSTLGKTIRYTPSDVFETFPQPEYTHDLERLGVRLQFLQKGLMRTRGIGLTVAYNMIADRSVVDDDVESLRVVHKEIDEELINAYAWRDRMSSVGGLDHGFHIAGGETRYVIGPGAQREVLDSLLELNHERYAEEVAHGLHNKKPRRAVKKMRQQEGMFDA